MEGPNGNINGCQSKTHIDQSDLLSGYMHDAHQIETVRFDTHICLLEHIFEIQSEYLYNQSTNILSEFCSGAVALGNYPCLDCYVWLKRQATWWDSGFNVHSLSIQSTQWI